MRPKLDRSSRLAGQGGFCSGIVGIVVRFLECPVRSIGAVLEFTLQRLLDGNSVDVVDTVDVVDPVDVMEGNTLAVSERLRVMAGADIRRGAAL